MIMKDTTNPYTPPTAEITAYDDETRQLEAIRREHLYHEVSIRSVGTVPMIRIQAILL